MMSDTLAYDGDATAWELWQVPPPAFVQHELEQVQSPIPSKYEPALAQCSSADVAPTLHYSPSSNCPDPTDSFNPKEFEVNCGDAAIASAHTISAAVNASAEERPGCIQDIAALAPTLDYPPSRFTSFAADEAVCDAQPDNIDVCNDTSVFCETQLVSNTSVAAIAPTFQYSPPRGKNLATVDASVLCETQIVAPTSPLVVNSLKDNRPGDDLSGFTSVACETQFVAPTLAYDTQPAPCFEELKDLVVAPTLAYDTQVAPCLENLKDLVVDQQTLNYEEMPLPGELPPTLAYHDAIVPDVEDVTPTLDYVADCTLRPDIDDLSAPLASKSDPAQNSRENGICAAPPGDTAFTAPAVVADAGSSNTRASAVAHERQASSAAVEDTSIFAAIQGSPPGPKRRRLRGKQLAPETVQIPAVAADMPALSAASSAQPVPSSHTAAMPAVQLSEAGTQVIVRGDGWGGGSGEYLATVTETDAFTYTVIRQFEGGRVEETHVLRDYCVVVSEPPQRPEAKRPRHSR